MSQPKFKKGDVVKFAYAKNDGSAAPSSSHWIDGNKTGVGIVKKVDNYGARIICLVRITSSGWCKGYDLWFEELAIRPDKTVQPQPATQEFQVGDEVEFTHFDNFPARSAWDRKGKIGRGIVTKLLRPELHYKRCEITIFDPHEIRDYDGSLLSQEEWSFFTQALRLIKSAPHSPTPTSTKSTPPVVVDEHAKELKFFAGEEENIGTCDKCGTGLKQLARTKYCPKCG